MSAKERILETALALFNAEGVGALSALDIATAMGISPGHLYYHFKGKAELALALARGHAEEMRMILEAGVEACAGDDADLETLWTHVHILAEEAWDTRFLYREAGALALMSPDLEQTITAVLAATQDGLARMLLLLREQGVLAGEPEAFEGVAQLMTTGVGWHVQTLRLAHKTEPPRELVARAAAQIMIPVAGMLV